MKTLVVEANWSWKERVAVRVSEGKGVTKRTMCELIYRGKKIEEL